MTRIPTASWIPNLPGIPREGVGASNDAKGHFGSPKFDAAVKFRLAAAAWR